MPSYELTKICNCTMKLHGIVSRNLSLFMICAQDIDTK